MSIVFSGEEVVFKKVVVGSTGLALASMLGFAAAVTQSKGSLFQFEWNWSIPAISVAVLIWNFRFWSIVWELQERSTSKAKARFFIHLSVLFILGLVSFLSPIRLIEHGCRTGLLHGLATALLFLSVAFFLLYKLGKGLREMGS